MVKASFRTNKVFNLLALIMLLVLIGIYYFLW